MELPFQRLRPFAAHTAVVLACSELVAACSFTAGAAPVDAVVAIDAEMDGAILGASCNNIHTTNPSLPSGAYVIDPDGLGGDPPLPVTCDMSLEGGGWTIVFVSPSSNLTAPPAAYTSATNRLLTDAQTTLLAYRTGAQTVTSDYATLDLPDAWRTDTPFDYPMSDLMTDVSIDGIPAGMLKLRFGYLSFQNYCSDDWQAAIGPFGRICIVGTAAPFFSAFGASYADTCSNSLSPWSSTNCSSDVRFSIAVR